MVGLRRNIARIRQWGPVVDQFLFGAASGILLLSASATLSPSQFGEFGLAYTFVASVLVIWRGGVLARLTLIDSHTELSRRLTRLVKPLMWVSLAPILLSLWFVFSAHGSDGVAGASIVICASLPMLMLYETLRQGMMMLDKNSMPLTVSFIWLLASLLFLALSLSRNSVWPGLLGWVLSGLLGVGVLLATFKRVARSHHGPIQAGDNDPTPVPSLWHFSLVSLLTAMAGLGIALVAYLFAGPVVLATIIVLNTAMYPLSVYTQAAPILIRNLSNLGVRGLAVTILGAVALAFLWYLALQTVFANPAVELLGSSWVLSKSLLWLAGLNLATTASIALSVAYLHRNGRASTVRWLILSTAPIRVLLALIVAVITRSAEWIILVEFIAQFISLLALLGFCFASARTSEHRRPQFPVNVISD